jgi:hypothetical protein
MLALLAVACFSYMQLLSPGIASARLLSIPRWGLVKLHQATTASSIMFICMELIIFEMVRSICHLRVCHLLDVQHYRQV